MLKKGGTNMNTHTLKARFRESALLTLEVAKEMLKTREVRIICAVTVLLAAGLLFFSTEAELGYAKFLAELLKF